MPNWCSTNYVIEGSQKTLQKIYGACERECLKSQGELWVGNILKELGYKQEEIEKNRNLRGFLTDYPHMENGVLMLNFEEAWGVTDFRFLIEKKFKYTKVYFTAEEPGLDYFVTNDEVGKYFPERFWVDTCIDGDYESDYFVEKEEAYNYVYSISGLRTDEEIDEFNRTNNDDFIYIHEYGVV